MYGLHIRIGLFTVFIWEFDFVRYLIVRPSLKSNPKSLLAFHFLYNNERIPFSLLRTPDYNDRFLYLVPCSHSRQHEHVTHGIWQSHCGHICSAYQLFNSHTVRVLNLSITRYTEIGKKIRILFMFVMHR